METVSYQDLLDQVRQLTAGEAEGEPPAGEFARFRRLFNGRLRSGLEFAAWPDWTRYERRAFRDAWASGTTYAAGAEVYHVASDQYYQSLRAANTGNAPADANNVENSAWWAALAGEYSGADWLTATAYTVGTIVYYPVTQAWYQCFQAHTSSGTLTPNATGADARWGVLTVFNRYIAWEQTGQTVIGYPVQVTERDPRQTLPACNVWYYQSNVGLQVPASPSRVWVTFKLRSPRLTGTAWSADSIYTAGEQVYYQTVATPGNFYDCVTTTTAGESPASAGAKWSLIELPQFLEDYLVQGVYADWLPGDGQNDKRLTEAALAADYLGDAKMRIFGQQQLPERFAVVG